MTESEGKEAGHLPHPRRKGLGGGEVLPPGNTSTGNSVKTATHVRVCKKDMCKPGRAEKFDVRGTCIGALFHGRKGRDGTRTGDSPLWYRPENL